MTKLKARAGKTKKVKKLVTNQAQCNNCGEVVVSINQHDWRSCLCWNYYQRIQIAADKAWEELNVEDQLLKQKLQKQIDSICHGIFVDGGREYQRFGFHKKEDFLDLSKWK